MELRRGSAFPVRSSGIWSGDVDGARPGHGYKFHIRSRHGGYRVDKADPFAFHSELPPRTGSVVWTSPTTGATRTARGRAEQSALTSPMSIYEVHAACGVEGPTGPS